MYPNTATLVCGYWRYAGISLAVGIAGGAVLVLGALSDPPQFYRAYLAAYVFYLGLTLGSLALLMIYHVTGGAWGFLIRRFLEAGIRTLPLVAIGFLPIALGIGELYPWAIPDAAEYSHVIAGQSIYLNGPFFYARAGAYFVLWGLLTLVLIRLSLRQDRLAEPHLANWLDTTSGLGLLLFGVSMHFAAVDWLLALQPTFHSTIFGPIVVSGQLLSALSLAIVALVLLRSHSPFAELLGPSVMIDLGNLLLSFIVVWTYLGWFQYLLSWIANLPYDAVWYLPRLHDGWQWMVLLLVIFQFALPVALLLWRAAKSSPPVLGGIAALTLLMQLAFNACQVLPPFFAVGLAGNWMALVAPVALGGIWLAYYLWRLASLPVLPGYDYNEASAVRLRLSEETESTWEEAIPHG